MVLVLIVVASYFGVWIYDVVVFRVVVFYLFVVQLLFCMLSLDWFAFRFVVVRCCVYI